MLAGVPLGGVDVFHWANDRHMRARGLAGNHCAFVIELDGRLDLGALEARLARAVALMPELSWRLGRVPVGPPRWVLGPPPAMPLVRLLETGAESAPTETIEALLGLRLDGDHTWAADLVRAARRDTFVFRWYHSLADARSAERLVRWLGSGDGDGDGGGPPAPPSAGDRFSSQQRPLATMSRQDRFRAMQAYRHHVLALGDRPILSPASLRKDRKPPSRPEPSRTVRVHLTEDETKRFDEIVRTQAKLAESNVMVLACARALDAFFVANRHAPPRYAVPIPLSLDPKAAATRLLGNNLSMMMFALDREDLSDRGRALARLADQQRAIVRGKLDVGMMAALDFARYLPPSVFYWLATRPFAGEMASFVFSNPGAITIERFAGLPVIDAFPLPAVVSPPGIQMTFTRFRGRLSVFVGYLESALDRPEAAHIAEALGRELLT